MDRVLIADFAQGWQESIYYPDTTLTLSVMDTVPVLQRRWHPLPVGTTFTVCVAFEIRKSDYVVVCPLM
ncbi:MAG: hypothetical protein MJZ52_02230 [Bacteroidales bacterium]|nr:hypothetical protein [Bacteroidales bacterium]